MARCSGLLEGAVVLAIVAGAVVIFSEQRAQPRPHLAQPGSPRLGLSTPGPVRLAHDAPEAPAGAQAFAPAPRSIAPTAAFKQLQLRVEAARSRENILAAYGPLIRRLGLEPAKASQLEDLLAQETLTARDALAAAKAQGAQSYQEYKTAVEEAISGEDQAINRLLGGDGYAQLDAYRQTLPEQETVAKLANRLSDSATPLNESQQAQLVALIDQMEPAVYRQNEAFLAVIGMSEAPLSGAMVNAAQAMLAPPQLGALQALQSAWLARAQLDQSLRRKP